MRCVFTGSQADACAGTRCGDISHIGTRCGAAEIQSEGFSIKAGYILIDLDSSQIEAKFRLDTDSAKVEFPELTEGSETITCETLKLNYRTEKAYIKALAIKQDEFYFKMGTAKRQANDELHLRQGILTTCDLPEPHYHFQLSKGVVVPEYVFMAFQAAFATITCCLIVGSFAERAKFSAIVVFVILWFTFSYLPIAHMVWFWPGPDDIKDAASLEAITARAGWLWQKGVLDFAGGTVVHINAAIAGLVGSFVIGKRLGYGKEAMKPHNLVYVMTGAALLWFGWFGFNAGSALEANGTAGLAFVNTYLATAAAVLGWSVAEWVLKGKPSMLGAASGCVAGLVAITPAAGFAGPMGAIIIGLIAGVVCLWGVTGLKKILGSDDSLDVFGVHGVGGITGALLTGVFADPALGGSGIWDYVANAVAPDYSIASQLWIQAQGVITTVIWSGVVSFVAFKLIDIVIGLRVKEEEEREGLDISSHGETAYES